MDSRDKLKKFVFTLNNYTEAEETAIRGYIIRVATYAIVGHEVAPETKTPHLQGFVNLSKQSRFTAIKKIMPRAHVEKARGTDEENRTYCSKAGDYWEHGEPQKAGKRNDLKVPCEALKAGQRLSVVAAAHPETFVKYHRGLQVLAGILQKPRNPSNPPVVMWIYGKSGVGKTRFAFDNLQHEEIYVKDSTQWWDGYEGQYCILVDDFDNKWPFRELLRFMDRYPYRAQIKGGYVQVNSPVIIITCEFAPSYFWTGNDLAQVERRITHSGEIMADGSFKPT